MQNNLSAFFLTMFNKDNSSLGFLIESYVPKYILLKTYQTLLKESELIPIENLMIEEKIKLADECRSTGLKFTNQSLTDAAKILHTIKFINENS